MATVGINVEHPSVFTYGGRWYSFSAMITNPDVGVKPQALDIQHIELFEYVNQINSLCLTGTLVYRDIDGSISRFFNRTYNQLAVCCDQLEKKMEGSIEKLVPIDRGPASSFIHLFIVQNIEIITRDRQEITYRLHLISENWYKAISNIYFSNYSNKFGDKEKNIVYMIEKFLEDDGLEVDTDSFNKAIEVAKPVSFDYITSSNDDLFTAIPFLLDRLYYIGNFQEKIKDMLFLVYDSVEFNYKIVNYSNTDTWLKIDKPNIIFSLFETQYEQSLFSVNNQMGTTRAKTQTDQYENFFTHRFWHYSRDVGTIYPTILNTKQIATFSNKKSDTFAEMAKGATLDKYFQELNKKMFVNDINKYSHDMQGTNNDYTLYANVVENLISKDAFVVNTEGDITHRPGCAMAIVLDRTLEKLPEEMPDIEKEAYYQKHRQIEAVFPVLKVRHIYKTSKPASYTENVVLGRNWLLEPKNSI